MRTALRLLPLPFCIALSLPVQAEDPPPDYSLCPIGSALPAFENTPLPSGDPTVRADQPTDIVGDAIAGVVSDSTVIQGNVQLTRGDQFLGTDKLIYNNETDRYVAEGHVRYQDSSMRMLAERAEGDQQADSHRLDNVQYQLVSRRGNGGADRMTMQGTDGILFGSTYSTCDPDDRMWELRAEQIDVDTAEGMATAHNATLRIGNVPVLYVPYAVFPIDNRRRTGLLYPSIGTSGRNGFDYRQPIYLNLAPNYDATLIPRYMSKRGFMLDTEFRYLTETGRGTLDAAYLPNDDLRDRDRGQFRFLAFQGLGPNWSARSNLNWISDPYYVEDFSSTLTGISPVAISSDLGVYGRGRYWNAGLMARYNILADYTLSDINLPYHQLPRAYAHWEQPFGRWFSAGIDTEAVRFAHPVRDGGSRVDVKPFVAMSLEGASWFVNPKLAWRYTGYQLDEGLANILGSDVSPSRSLPIASLDAGLFFDREMQIDGDSYLHTLEPRLFYLNVPYRDQSHLPLFDTRPLSFSWGQLFRDNRYSGADRQSDANQLTLALTSRLIRESDGREKMSASIGQIRYFDDSIVTLPGEIPVERGSSAWVADVGYAINDRWTASASYQWDPKFRREDLISFRTRYLIGDDGIVNLSYRYRRDLLEQVDLSFLYPVSPTWSIVGRYYHSIQDNKLLEGIAGVQWDSCCMAARLVVRRYVRNRTGEMNNALMFELELKGLGSAGRDTEDTLRRAILGYYRDDLYLVPPPEVRDNEDNLGPDPLQ